MAHHPIEWSESCGISTRSDQIDWSPAVVDSRSIRAADIHEAFLSLGCALTC